MFLTIWCLLDSFADLVLLIFEADINVLYLKKSDMTSQEGGKILKNIFSRLFMIIQD